MSDYMRGVRFDCQDCGHDTARMGELYMLDDDLWLTITLTGEPAHMLCIGCAETRLGWQLSRSCFTEAPLNWLDDRRRSLRLRKRLRNSPEFTL